MLVDLEKNLLMFIILMVGTVGTGRMESWNDGMVAGILGYWDTDFD